MICGRCGSSVTVAAGIDPPHRTHLPLLIFTCPFCGQMATLDMSCGCTTVCLWPEGQPMPELFGAERPESAALRRQLCQRLPAKEVRYGSID